MNTKIEKAVDFAKNYKPNKSAKIIAVISILILSFLISLICALTIENKREKFILAFPSARVENQMILRPRYAVKKPTKEEQIKELVMQVGLGPNEELRDKSFAFMPLGVRAKTVFIDGTKLFLELPKDFILQGSTVNYKAEKSLEFLKYNLIYNFSWISELTVTVDGVVLYTWSDSVIESNDEQKN